MSCAPTLAAMTPFRSELTAELQQPIGRANASLFWFGQAGFAICSGGPDKTVILIDPYLSDALAEKYHGKLFAHTRLMQVPVQPTGLPRVDLVLCSHRHGDHMDIGTLPALARQHSTAQFICPRAHRARIMYCGVPPERLQTMTGDPVESPLEIAGVRVTALPSAHETLQYDADGNSLFLGFVVEMAGVRIYHSGDCAPYIGRADRLRGLSIDMALLPVNGRDAYRFANGVPGNFSLDEAVQLCLDARIPTLLAHHIGMFQFNTVPFGDVRSIAARLERSASPLKVFMPAYGARYELTR